MQLYYAIGGGLGHLARASAFFYTQKHLIAQECLLLTASKYSEIEFLPDFHQVVQLPENFHLDRPTYLNFLHQLIEKYQIDSIYLDAFPVGILGEWLDLFENTQLNFFYIARLLSWKNYAPLLGAAPIRFVESFVVEQLLPSHEAFVQKHSQKISMITLNYPSAALSSEVVQMLQNIRQLGQRIWLVIHSTPTQEVLQLLEYAREVARFRQATPCFVLISQDKLPLLPLDVVQLKVIPSAALFEQAELIFSACGFNLMQQLLPYRTKHLFIPFERKYDLQFERARLRKKDIMLPSP